MDMKERLQELAEAARKRIEESDGPDKLNEVKVAYLGKKGELTAILKSMKDVAPEDRPKVGQMVNETRAKIEEHLEATRKKLEEALREEKMKSEVIDVTLPAKKAKIGHRHPNSIALEEVERIFIGMGYEVVEGPEVEYADYNFTKLNIPEDHPARDEQDTFYIGGDILKNPNNVRLYANSSSSLSLESNITGQIEDIIEAEKLKSYNIENLSQILQEVKTRVGMQTFRNDESQEEEAHAKSSVVATGMGFVLGMILYMFLLIYGAMVMQSVIEEKNNRVLEVVVSSIRPFQLMMGKILGVASVAVVQVLIWGVLVVGVGTLVMPHLVPQEVMQNVEAMQAGGFDAAAATGVDVDMLQAVATATDMGYILQLFIFLMLYVVGGYLLYSAMFAAVGSSVDSIQDAQQLHTPIMIPIILSIFVMMAVMNDPNSQLAFWFSMIPFTSPVVMMARIPAGIPLWEIVVSLVLLYLSFAGMVWVAAKIYRVGIFMYGKKPNLKEVCKWVRYKY